MNDFDHESEALFRAARDATDPDSAAEVRIRKALTSQLGAAAFIASGAKGAAVVSSKGGASIGGLWAKTAAHFAWAAKVLPMALIPVLGGGAVVGYRYLAPRAQETPVVAISMPKAPRNAGEHLAPPAATPEISATPELPATEVGDDKGIATSPETHPATSMPGLETHPATSMPATAPHRGQTPSTLSDEVTLVARMHELWRSGDLAGLDRTIAEHQRRFPRGILAEERDAMRAMLTCRRGAARASDVAKAFAEGHAGSPHLARVNAVCNEQQR